MLTVLLNLKDTNVWLETKVEALSAAWRPRLFEIGRYLLLLLAVSLPFCLLRLSHFAISIDDEYAVFRGGSMEWVLLGRWSNHWIERWLLRQPALPMFTDALFCALMGVTYLILLRLHRATRNWQAAFLFPLFAFHPILLVLGEFYANTLPTAVGYLAVALAIYFLHGAFAAKRFTSKVAFAFAQSSCLAVAIGCYQSFFFFYLALAAGSLLVRRAQSKNQLFKTDCLFFVGVGASAFAGFLLYLIVAKVHLYGLTTGRHGAYLDSYIQGDRLRSDPVGVFRDVVVAAKRVYGGASDLYGAPVKGFAWLVTLAGGLGAVQLIRSASLTQAARNAMFTAQLAVAPLLLNFGGRFVPLRTFVAIPYVVWAVAYFVCNYRSTVVRHLAALLVLAVYAQMLVLGANYSAAAELTLEADKSFASLLYHDIAHDLPGFDYEKVYDIEIFGQRPALQNPFAAADSATTKASFFSWDGGNPHRMVAFMRVLGLHNLRALAPQTRRALQPQFTEMPVWPAPGAIKWQGGTILVKLGQLPGFYPL